MKMNRRHSVLFKGAIKWYVWSLLLFCLPGKVLADNDVHRLSTWVEMILCISSFGLMSVPVA